MFLRRYQELIAKLALFVVLFASLAPSVSHAVALHTGNTAFSQTICTTNGDVVVIEVLTTKGQEIKTELTLNQTGSESNKHIEINLIHCPFCATAGADLSVAQLTPFYLFTLAKQAKAAFLEADVLPQKTCHQTAHQTRAPPLL